MENKLYSQLTIHEKINVRSSLFPQINHSRISFCFGNNKNNCGNIGFEQPYKLNASVFGLCSKRYMKKHIKF